jgi:hypothetical protein
MNSTGSCIDTVVRTLAPAARTCFNMSVSIAPGARQTTAKSPLSCNSV